MKKVENLKSAAVLTIHDAGNMTKIGKKNIANWLKKQANSLLADGHLYSKKFTARFQYTEKP
jgi:hypothetical protein